MRFGDPEAQLLLPLITTDLAPMLAATTLGRRFNGIKSVEFLPDTVMVGVVLSAPGYPGEPRKGDVISGLDQVDTQVFLFHGGTIEEGGVFKTAGGRIFTVVGQGPTYKEARTQAYREAEKIRFEGRQMHPGIADHLVTA